MKQNLPSPSERRYCVGLPVSLVLVTLHIILWFFILLTNDEFYTMHFTLRARLFDCHLAILGDTILTEVFRKE